MNLWENNDYTIVMKTIKKDSLFLKTPYGTVFDLVIHLFNAINHWLDYIDTEYTFPRKDPDVNLSDWSVTLNLWKKTDHRWIKVIESLEEFTSSFGNHKMIVGEMFLHISHHSYYHRGQLAMFFRQHHLPKFPETDADVYFNNVS